MSSPTSDKPGPDDTTAVAPLTERERQLERKLRLTRTFSSMFAFGVLGGVIMAFLMPRLIVFWEGGINNVCEPFAAQVVRKLHMFEFGGLCVGLLSGLVLALLRNRRRPPVTRA